jgi:hypothetical protein
VELLGGGLAVATPAEAMVFVAAYDLEHLTSAGEYGDAVRAIDELMRSSDLRPGFDEVLFPAPARVSAGDRPRRTV